VLGCGAVSLPRRNLELKAVDPDPPATLDAALALPGVEDHGVLIQRDTYFFAVQARLKLREAWAGGDHRLAELITYARADREGPKVSHYRVVQVADHVALAEALTDALGVRAVVEKERRLLTWRGVRIHLDRVAELGAFVEFEAVAQSIGGLEAEQAKVAELRDALGLSDDRLLVARGYAELLGA
jgi:predicted adenylyl cyclase CyaB